MPEQPNHQLADGHNNAAGLTALETLLSADYGFGLAQSLGNYNPGRAEERYRGLEYYNGYPSTAWQLSVLTFAQYDYLFQNLCDNGTYTGLVTVRTDIDPGGAFANYNATMRIPKPDQLQLTENRLYIVEFTIQFTRMEAV